MNFVLYESAWEYGHYSYPKIVPTHPLAYITTLKDLVDLEFLHS